MAKIIKINIEPKPMERNNKIEVPEKLEPVATTAKPMIELNLSDRFNIFLKGATKFFIDVASKVIKHAIPWWLWILLIAAVVAVIVLR